MRTLLTGSLFALALLVAACGGGGTSSVIPGGTHSGGVSGPSSVKTTNAVIVLKIPAPGQQVSRRPFYLSSGTQALGVLVVPATSTETPTPTNLTIFPVATPSPCAAASAGGYTCTLNVTAPIGVDNFFVGAFATASPNANAVPLSEYMALGVTVSASPAPNATPLTFTLDGVIYKVVLTVPSPDPGNTPNTQVFPAGVAVSSVPLGVAAYDSNNTQILTNVTNTFANPIVIAAPSPAGDGVSLSLNGATCSGTAITGGNVSIACAADLNKVEFAYDGTTHPDTNDHIIDTFTISTSTQQVNPTPSPAYVVLSSNALSWQLPVNDSSLYQGQLALNGSGQFVYMASDGDGGNYLGTFDPSTQTVVNSGTLSDVGYPEIFALDSTGTFWLADSGYGVLDCWPSVPNAVSGTPPPVSITPFTPGGDSVSVTAVAVDASNNIWYVGYDSGSCGEECDARRRYQASPIPSSDPYYSYAGYVPATACNDTVNTEPTASVFLSGDGDYDYPFVAPLNSASGNGVFVTSNTENGAYVITTASGAVNPVMSQLDGGEGQGWGAAVDGAGTAYAAFTGNSVADIETMSTSASALNTLLGLPSTSGSPAPYLVDIDAFSPTGAAADRIDYADQTFDTLGLVEGVPASPMPLLAPVPNGAYALWATHSSKGGEYMLYVDSSGNLDVGRVIPTTTWSVPTAQFESACGEVEGLLGIVERGDRGPFTVTYNTTPASNTLLAGTDHDYLTQFSSASSLSVQVQDAGGRTESYPISIVTIPAECGARHRPLHRGPRVRARSVGKRLP